ncbi:protein kinase, putative [Bodo saltans]|uniref:Protein kinase, putative n=1 Tax=Bodo saltans TaxID=75058 RepID=A0A0S4J757_BODSA|nr:protein kinase, putative [Bodo saltans]|eukprot:CUG77057.1 protein kinase, putative [Bodo saltans]
MRASYGNNVSSSSAAASPAASAAAARVSPVNAVDNDMPAALGNISSSSSSSIHHAHRVPIQPPTSFSSPLLFDQWGVPPSLEKKYIIGPEVGRGSCSIVREVICRETGVVYVAKISSVKDTTAYNPEEAEVVMAARHENIVRGVDVFVSATHSALVMEDLRRGGELFHIVQKSSAASSATVPAMSPTSPCGSLFAAGATSCLPEPVVAKYVHDVLSALHYLHDVMGVVHRDVKLENIMLFDENDDDAIDNDSALASFDRLPSTQRGAAGLVSGTMTAKLIDFGFSKRIGCSKVLKACCGSPNYMSPEMLRASRTQDQNFAALPTRHLPYGNEVDLWATGVLMYVMLVGKYPFYNERRSVWHKSILLGQYHLPSTVEVSASGKDLLAKLLTVRSEDRLRASEALAHPWFREFGDVSTQQQRVPRPYMTTPSSADRPSSQESSGSLASYGKVPQATVVVLATPPRKVHTPPIAEQAAGAAAAGGAAASSYLSPPHNAVLSAAFTPPHNHALFMDTPMAKSSSTNNNGATATSNNIRGGGAALF